MDMDSRNGTLGLLAAAAALLLAGCVAPAAQAPDAEPLAAAPAGGAPALVPVDHVFESGWTAGAAFEPTAHFMPSEEVTEGVWKAGFVLDVTEVPQDLRLQLDFTGAPGTRMLIMAHAPHDDHRAGEQGWSEYTTEFSEQSPQCMRIPPEDLLAGSWYVMTHSQVSANVAFTITATTLGGAAAILDGPHGHDTNHDEVLKLVYTETSPKRAWLPCDEA